MSNKQLRTVIARRKAIQKKAQQPANLLAACVAAAGFDEHRAY